jgi:hypothetical protein
MASKILAGDAYKNQDSFMDGKKSIDSHMSEMKFDDDQNSFKLAR